jgi:serine/threonine-protein kinase NIM1
LFRDEMYLGAPVDIWALGVLLYFMVTAQMPFKAPTVAVLKKHVLEGTFSIPGHVSFQCRKLIGESDIWVEQYIISPCK